MIGLKTVTLLLAVILSIPAFSASIASRNSAIDTAMKQVSDGILIKEELHMEGRTLVYNVVVLAPTDKLQVVEISAANGTIIQTRDESLLPNGETILANKVQMLRQAKINYTDAINTALKDMTDSVLIKFELDADSKRVFYNIEFADINGYKYEAIVDAIDGTLLYRDLADLKRYSPGVTRMQAEKTALDFIKGIILYTVISDDDKEVYYKVTGVSDDPELYEIYVDANLGKVVKIEIK